jgi:flagellar FliJ protein
VLDRLLDAQRYESVLRAQLNVYREQAMRVAEEIERRRQLLIEADRDVHILEKLREKQLARHNDELAREEMKELDELAGRIRREAAQA